MCRKITIDKILITALTITLAAALIAASDYFDTVSVSAAQPLQTANGVPTTVIPAMTEGAQEGEYSEAALAALAQVAEREGIPFEALTITADHPTEFPALRRSFQVVTLVDTRPEGRVYKLLVDLVDYLIVDNVPALLRSETEAHRARYGSLEPALYERLQPLQDEDTVVVAVWVAAQPGQTLAELQRAAFDTLAARYLEAAEAMERTGKPFVVDDPELAERIYREYIDFIKTGNRARTQPLVTEIENRGFTITTYDGVPCFAAVLPKYVVQELSNRQDVRAIYLIETEVQPTLDSAVPGAFAPTVWGRGYDGGGQTIAIMDPGNVRTKVYLHLSPNRRDSPFGETQHATLVANDAASFDETYTGMAPGATILSVGTNEYQWDVPAALEWALEEGASVINFSAVYEYDNNMNWTDKVFDYWAYQGFKPIIAAAGNSGGSLGSPAKAWNVITVGAHDDYNDTNWAGDQMWGDSSYVNPYSVHNDREKPEVVAVGGNYVTSRALPYPNPPVGANGTSMAAPQVAGLAALLLQRDSDLQWYPEVVKAIIMASATHNIEGPLSIPYPSQGDQKDGAGAINAELADRIAQVKGWADTPCDTSCWWLQEINDQQLPEGEHLERTFNASQGDVIRVVISWWSDTDGPPYYSVDTLNIDLDLRIKDPYGLWVANASSQWSDNNYEMVQFIAPLTGQYTIDVENFQVRDEDPNWENWVGIALAKIHRVYSPPMMRSYQ